jgi:hypothetical protein
LWRHISLLLNMHTKKKSYRCLKSLREAQAV